VHDIGSATQPPGKFGHPADFASTLDWINANGYKVLTCKDVLDILGSFYDVNNDGIVNFVGLALFANYYQQGDCGECGGFDFTEDGKVDNCDLEKFIKSWLKKGRGFIEGEE
jgi:hypothetical protein